MPGLATFSDFLLATKVTRITAPNDILNDAVRNSYLLSEMLKGRGDARSEVIQNGSSIKDDIMLSSSGTFGFYSPNAEFSPQDVDTLTSISQGWRFAKTFYGYNDETIALNMGNSENVWINLKQKYQQQARTDMMNGMEDALWAVPVYSTMEQGSGDNPPAYSIPAYVNEATNGVWPGFTLKQGQNPSTVTGWRPAQESYDPANVADEASGLLAAFDAMYLDVKFESPDEGSQYFENDRLRRMKIITNKNGHKIYKRLLRAGNDFFRQGAQDPEYNNPRYAGIPIKYIATLDTAALEITSQTTASGAAWPATKPRFYWLNLEFLFPIWHSTGYMEQVGPIAGGITQPFSHAVYFRNWYNLFCRSLKRQGIVYPSA